MSGTEPASPHEPADPRASREDAPNRRPDWLMGSDEGASRAGEDAAPSRRDVLGRAPQPRGERQETPRLDLVNDGPGSSSPAPGLSVVVPAPNTGPVAWKAAASSVPRLREQPAAMPADADADEESFPGFAQDGVLQKHGASAGAARPETTGETLEAPSHDGTLAEELTALDHDPGFLIDWMDRLRFMRHPIALAVGAVLVCSAVGAHFLLGHDSSGVSLAQIRQQPEAFEGRPVLVAGRAGEAFAIGGSYVFDLYQGRDTIVVYSRSRRPGLHEDVKVRGNVSIGYLDGAPRITVFEETATP